MDESILKLLHDINESIDSIESYLGSEKNFLIYDQNKMQRRAVERELGIIGEAMSRLKKQDKEISISNGSQIIALRNRVIHGYDKVDNEIVWGIIVRHLPILKQEVDNLIENN